MVALSKKTDYAIIALAHMAQTPGRLCSAREIAEAYHMPAPLLMNVLKTMTQGELVRSIRGAKGGYSLALPAERITVADIIAAVEGPIRFVQCAGADSETATGCRLVGLCPVTRPVHKVHARLREFMKQVTLADIAHDGDYGNRHGSASSEEFAAENGAETR